MKIVEDLANARWQDNNLQFARLLAEISMAGMSLGQQRGVCESMDITPQQLASLLERAEDVWESLLVELLTEDAE